MLKDDPIILTTFYIYFLYKIEFSVKNLNSSILALEVKF